jgi:gluconate kinase
MIFVLFGLPGAGKTFVGRVLGEKFGFYVYEADQDLPVEMRRRLERALPVTDVMRDEFFGNIVKRVKSLRKKHSRIVVTQTFIKEKYRRFFLQEIPNARFILVDADNAVREARLRGRKEFPLDGEYGRQMVEMFEEPKIAHDLIVNNIEGKGEVPRQIRRLLE